MAVLFELKNKAINLASPLVIEVMEYSFNHLCELMAKKVIPPVVTEYILNESGLIDDIVEYVQMFSNAFLDNISYDDLATIVGDLLMEFEIGERELYFKNLGNWFAIIPNDLERYTVK